MSGTVSLTMLIRREPGEVGAVRGNRGIWTVLMVLLVFVLLSGMLSGCDNPAGSDGSNGNEDNPAAGDGPDNSGDDSSDDNSDDSGDSNDDDSGDNSDPVGDGSVDIDFENPVFPEIVFTGATEEVTAGVLLVVSVEGTYTGHSWYLNGSDSHDGMSAVGDSVTIDTNLLNHGTHTLSLIVAEGYSGQVSFTVVDAPAE